MRTIRKFWANVNAACKQAQPLAVVAANAVVFAWYISMFVNN